MEKEIDEIKESSSWAPRERREINIHSGEISHQSPSDKNLLLDLKRRKLEAFSEELTMMQTTATSKKGIRSQDLNASFPNEGNTNTLSSRFVYDTPQKNIRRDWPKAPMTAPGHKNRAHSYISAGVQGTRKIYTSSGKKDPPNYPYNISNNNSGVFSIPQQTGIGKMRITSQRGSMDTSLNAKLQDTLQREREISMRGNIEFMQRENIELVKKHRLKEDELKQKISLLQGKVGKMKNINRDLLLNNSGKNLFMEDADREMEEMYSQLQEARDENKLGSRQMGKLRAENENIKVVVNRYRKMATQLNTEIRNLKEKGTWRNTGLNSPFPGASPNNKDKADVASEQDSSTFGISPFRVIADNMSEMSQDISPSPTHTHKENLGTSGLISLITCTYIHEHNELYGAWCTIAESLPNRSVQSQQNLIRRKFNPNNYKGHWTKEEEKTLIDMISRVRKKWGIIAEELNRTPTNIKDKYKQIGGDNYKLRASIRILWTVGDIIKLIKAVQKVTQINILVKKSVIKKAMQEVYQTDESNKTQSITENPNSNSVRYKRIRKRIEDENLQRVLSMIVLEDSREIIPYSNINWSLVVHKIKNRSIDDCRNKWYQQLFYLLTQKRRFTQLEDLNLIQQIHWTGAESIDEIDWNDIMNNKSISENKQRWIQLVKNLGINIGKNIQDIAQKLIEIIRNKQTNRSDIKKETKEEESIISYYNKYFAMSEQYI